MTEKPTYEELEQQVIELEQEKAERKRAKEEFVQIFKMSIDMVCVADIDTGTLIRVNPAFTEVLGYSEEELLGKPFLDFIHPDDIQPTRSIFENQLQAGAKVINFENRYQCKDGGYRWLSWMSHPDLKRGVTYAIARDITQIKEAENSLRRSEEKYKSLFDSINDGICLHEIIYKDNKPVDYRILDINPRYEELTGIKADEAKWAVASQLYKTGEAPYLEKYADVARTGIPVAFETYFPPMGKHFQISVFSPARHQFASVFQDITERKKMEIELRTSEKQLKASLCEREVMLKEIHHRVKNNMQVISSLMDLQANECQDPSIRTIFRDVNCRVRAMAMVHEMLYQSTDFARVQFADYIQSLLGYLMHAHEPAEHGIELKLDLGPVLLPVNEAVPCGLIFNELFTNSLKHAFVNRDSGKVTVSLRTRAPGIVSLSVSDNGIGLPPDMDIKKARSLGIRLVQMLAGQLHASLEVEKGEGTKFLIVFEVPESGAGSAS